ncbi:MAG: hypothetical protein CVU05_06240 [Bacteroidetes bacterium HGW-Bacteroidetes-21]|jgi:hypothetical protein|nr:MAG: hypothetical protein CVU05_06240 [Bacteroidetes bacterium HGW-Bacteroidetes-21]
MKIQIQPDSINWEEVKVKLETKFPEYKVKTRTKGFLIVAKSGTIGTNVLVRKKAIQVAGNFPTMGGSMIFVLSILLLGVLIPIIIYFAAFHSKMKKLETEVGEYLKQEYAAVVINK